MNKGEINTGESSENENVHKFNESVVSKKCCFKVKGLGAIRAKIGPASDDDKIFSKMCSQYVLFINKYS